MTKPHSNLIFDYKINAGTATIEEEEIFTDGRSVFTLGEPGYAIYGPVSLTFIEEYSFVSLSYPPEVTVEVSYDYQTTWHTVTGPELPNLYQSVSDTVVYFRISLGPDRSFTEVSLEVYGKPGVVSAWQTPETDIVMNGLVQLPDHEFDPTDLDSGALVPESTYLRINPLPDNRKIYAIEIWVRGLTQGTALLSFDSSSTRNGYAAVNVDSIYVDGSPSSLNITDSNWHRIVVVKNSGITSPVIINRDLNYSNAGQFYIGNITLHEFIPSAQDVLDSYKYIVGEPNLSISEELLSLNDQVPVIFDKFWSNVAPTM